MTKVVLDTGSVEKRIMICWGKKMAGKQSQCLNNLIKQE
jgi:hypothetical protein